MVIIIKKAYLDKSSGKKCADCGSSFTNREINTGEGWVPRGASDKVCEDCHLNDSDNDLGGGGRKHRKQKKKTRRKKKYNNNIKMARRKTRRRRRRGGQTDAEIIAQQNRDKKVLAKPSVKAKLDTAFKDWDASPESMEIKRRKREYEAMRKKAKGNLADRFRGKFPKISSKLGMGGKRKRRKTRGKRRKSKRRKTRRKRRRKRKTRRRKR